MGCVFFNLFCLSYCLFCLMIRPPPLSTRTAKHCPDTTRGRAPEPAMPAPSLSVPRAARARRRLLLPLLLVLPLAVGGCDAIYEDTKGWANRLEVSLLSATPDDTAPADAPAEEAGVEKTGVGAKHETMPDPPAGAVEPVAGV